jgi:hypothetical protein
VKLTSETLTKIAPALVKAQSEMGDASKGAKNPFFKSSFADLNAVREAVMPALNKHGISVLQPEVVFEGKNYVQTFLLHESGEFFSGITEVKVAKQNDAQAEGSGISYARRYGLQSLMNVGAVDDDGEKSMGRDKAKDKPAPASFKATTANTATVTIPTPYATTASPNALLTNGTKKPTDKAEASTDDWS